MANEESDLATPAASKTGQKKSNNLISPAVIKALKEKVERAGLAVAELPISPGIPLEEGIYEVEEGE